MAGTKPKFIKIDGRETSVAEAKRTRDALARGFALEAFTKETHMEHWRQWKVLVDKLREINEY